MLYLLGQVLWYRRAFLLSGYTEVAIFDGLQLIVKITGLKMDRGFDEYERMTVLIP